MHVSFYTFYIFIDVVGESCDNLSRMVLLSSFHSSHSVREFSEDEFLVQN
jgi:hypothetical protein